MRIKRYAIYDVVQSVDAMYRLTIRKQAIKTLQRMRARDASACAVNWTNWPRIPAGGTLT